MDFDGRVSQHFKCQDKTKRNEFLAKCQFVQGEYTNRADISRLHEYLLLNEPKELQQANRVSDMLDVVK